MTGEAMTAGEMTGEQADAPETKMDAPSVAPARSPVLAALAGAAERLVRVLDQETGALRARSAPDLAALCHRKNQALLELSRIEQKLDREPLDAELQALLARLRARLGENGAALDLHLRAAREVAEILADAIRDAESDGTYSTSGAMKAGV